MSFNFSFVASAPERALMVLGEQHAPASVISFIETSVHGIEKIHAGTNKPYLISVEASGHLCDGGGSYEVSTSKIEVKPIFVK